MPYQKSTVGTETKFEVQPEQAPSFLQAGLIVIVLPILFLFAISFMWGLIAAIGVGVWFYFMQKNKNITQYREPFSFSVTQEGIRLNGSFYKKEDIHRLIIRNHMNEKYLFVSDRQMYNNPVSTARALKFREKLTAVSYRVDTEVGGRPITIAGGLTEPTAYAILSDVSKVLDLKVS